MLVVVTATMVLMMSPSQVQALAAPEQQSPSYVRGPVADCAQLAGMVLGGIAVRSGAALWTVGAGAGFDNASKVIGFVSGVWPAASCVTYLAPRYIDLVCSRSHGPWWYRSTWEARALVSLATRGRATTC